MASQAYAALGAQLAVSNYPYSGTVETWTNILEASKVKGPGEKMDTVEVTSLDSVGYKEFITSLRDSGEISFDVNYTTPATGAGVSARTLRNNVTKMHYKITLPKSPTQTSTGDAYDFYGYVTGYDPSFDETKQISATITIKVTGAVNYTAGS